MGKKGWITMSIIVFMILAALLVVEKMGITIW